MKWLAYKYLIWRGWRFTGEIPDVPKKIIIGAPHTSNWDFILFLGALHYFQMKVRYIGKHTLFRWPFGYFHRRWGGIPVDRSKPGGLVGQVADAFAASDEMILVMAPEGTRKAAPAWKAGFLWIAAEANVPIVVAGVDGTNKTVDIGPIVPYNGDVDAFMGQVRDYLEGKHGIHPEGRGPVRIKEESKADS